MSFIYKHFTFPTMICPDCGKKMKVNAHIEQELVQDWFYVCKCGCMLESDGEKVGKSFSDFKKQQSNYPKHKKYLARVPYRNAGNYPVKPTWGNMAMDLAERCYCVPTCPMCGEPTYSEPECPFCGQPFKE